MKILVPVVAGIWLFVVGLQGLSHMARYGLLPLPEWVARVDFTPQFPLLLALVVLAAVLARWDR